MRVRVTQNQLGFVFFEIVGSLSDSSSLLLDNVIALAKQEVDGVTYIFGAGQTEDGSIASRSSAMAFFYRPAQVASMQAFDAGGVPKLAVANGDSIEIFEVLLGGALLPRQNLSTLLTDPRRWTVSKSVVGPFWSSRICIGFAGLVL